MNQKPRKSILSTGTTSFVLIFVLLCLLTFSVLSLVSANANLKLSRKSADRTTAYYDAENTANDILIQIDRVIEDSLQKEETGFSSQEFYDTIKKELEHIEELSFPEKDRLEYQVPLGEDQELHVTLQISPDRLSDGKHYQILSWDTESVYDWTPDQKLQLME